MRTAPLVSHVVFRTFPSVPRPLRAGLLVGAALASLVGAGCSSAPADAVGRSGGAIGSDQGGVCADGNGHTFRLAENRDRLLGTLASEKGTDTCTLWGNLSLAERTIFEMVTAYYASCSSRMNPPPSSSDETVLDHATSLYSINAPGLPSLVSSGVPSIGGAQCGGSDANRIFLGFDDQGIAAMRSFGALNPGGSTGYNAWRASNDPGGPHPPFDQRDEIRWAGLSKFCLFGGDCGPQWHFFAEDGMPAELGTELVLWKRRGVCGITDPNVVEGTIAFNSVHDSNPLCDSGYVPWVTQQTGDDFSYVPSGCDASPPSNTDPGGGGTHAGLGPDSADGTCACTSGSACAAVTGSSSPCAGLADGAYCGGDTVQGDSHTLYTCAAGALTASTPCAAGCQANGGGGDACTSSCSGVADGLYCGSDAVSGDPSTLYQCAGGSIAVSEVCANGCQTSGGGADACN